MKVKELIERSCYEKIWDFLMSDFFSQREYTAEKLDYFKESICKTVEIIKSMSVTQSDDWIIVLMPYYDDLADDDIIYIGSDLYKKSEIKEQFREDDVVEKDTDISLWDADKISNYFKTKPYVTTWGFEFSEWDEVIGFEVWQGSIDEFSLERCAAAILHEMTYCGFTPEQVKTRIEKIFNKSENEEIEMDIEETCDDSIEELLEEKSPEEQLENSLRISYKNWKMQYERLKALHQELQEGKLCL